MADGNPGSATFVTATVHRMALALRNAGFRVSPVANSDDLTVFTYDNDAEAEIMFTLAVTSEEVS